MWYFWDDKIIMEIVNKSLTIDVDLDDDVWGEIVKVTKSHDDISLIVKGGY